MGKYFIFLFSDMALTKDERVELIILCGRQGLTQRQVATVCKPPNVLLVLARDAPY
jgi:chromosome segregation and condensation protein ScpB